MPTVARKPGTLKQVYQTEARMRRLADGDLIVSATMDPKIKGAVWAVTADGISHTITEESYRKAHALRYPTHGEATDALRLSNCVKFAKVETHA